MPQNTTGSADETPKTQKPPTEGEPRKPAEDSFFAERDREMHDEKNPRSKHAPASTEQ